MYEYFGVIGPGFLNQVPTLGFVWFRVYSGAHAYGVRDGGGRCWVWGRWKGVNRLRSRVWRLVAGGFGLWVKPKFCCLISATNKALKFIQAFAGPISCNRIRETPRQKCELRGGFQFRI